MSKQRDELTDAERLAAWMAGIEDRVHARTAKQPARGLRSGPKPVAATAWKCEGQYQDYDQMDIWECLDEVELDERRKRGEDDDENE